MRQKSFNENKPTCYLVPTPIGNLQEMTPRAIETLKSVDFIACEDTRNTGKLCSLFNISTKMIAMHQHNEEEQVKKIIELLDEGKNIAIVSDAGYPLISDPGKIVVSKIIEHGYPVVPLSGCNAMLNALVASGLTPQPFAFIGFLPSTTSHRETQLKSLEKLEMTLIFYEAPHRITKMLESMLSIFGNRKIVIARELTKLHEEFIRGTITEILAEIDELKGEMVVVVEGYNEDNTTNNIDDCLSKINEYIEHGMKSSSAIKEVAKQYNISKNELYEQWIKMKENNG